MKDCVSFEIFWRPNKTYKMIRAVMENCGYSLQPNHEKDYIRPFDTRQEIKYLTT